MKFWLYFPLWIFLGDEVINLGLSLGSSPSGPSGWKAQSSSLVLTCPHSHTWHQALCVCVCVCVCMCTQCCLILCDPMSCRVPDSSIHGIFQARILEWVAISFSWGSSQPRDQTCVSVSPALAGKFFTSWATGKPRDQALVTLKYVSTIWSNCFQIFLWCWDISDMYQNCSLQNSKEEVFFLIAVPHFFEVSMSFLVPEQLPQIWTILLIPIMSESLRALVFKV